MLVIHKRFEDQKGDAYCSSNNDAGCEDGFHLEHIGNLGGIRVEGWERRGVLKRVGIWEVAGEGTGRRGRGIPEAIVHGPVYVLL